MPDRRKLGRPRSSIARGEPPAGTYIVRQPVYSSRTWSPGICWRARTNRYKRVDTQLARRVLFSSRSPFSLHFASRSLKYDARPLPPRATHSTLTAGLRRVQCTFAIGYLSDSRVFLSARSFGRAQVFAHARSISTIRTVVRCRPLGIRSRNSSWMPCRSVLL